MAEKKQVSTVDTTKRHFSAMLKHLPGQKDEGKAMDVVESHLRLFAGKEWEPVKAKLRQFANEDPLRVVSRRRPARLLPAERPLLTTSASAPPAVQEGAETTPPAGLPRLRTTSSLQSGRSRAPSTPRERWDITSRSPATPLSPTPMYNAFADGGFWQDLEPKTPATQTPPVTAIPPSPCSPVVPQHHEARAAYDKTKADIDSMARTICANRMSVTSKISNSDDVPNSLLKPRDILRGAELTLGYCQNNLSKIIDPDIFKALNALADEEKKILEKYSLRLEHHDELRGVPAMDFYLQVDGEYPNMTFGTIYDVQREALQMFRNRRKYKLLDLPDAAIQQAWATRILEDAQRVVDLDDNESYDSDETGGYDYGNFIRSIKHEDSSGSELASMNASQSYMSLASMRSSATNSDSLAFTGEQSREGSSKHSSTSPVKNRKFSLPFLSRENSLSDNPSSPEKSRLSALAGRRGLGKLSTTRVQEEYETEGEKSKLSPTDRAERRKGATPTAMNAWAEQLKELEEKEQERQHLEQLLLQQHPALENIGSAVTTTTSTAAPSPPSASTTPLRQHTKPPLSYELPPPPPGFRYALKSRASLEQLQHLAQHHPAQHHPAFHSHPTSSAASPTSPSSPTTPSPALRQPTKPPLSYDLPTPPPGFVYAPKSRASLHDAIRRKQHVRAKSGVDENEWVVKCDEMDMRESERQEEEKRRREEEMRRYNEARGGGGQVGWGFLEDEG